MSIVKRANKAQNLEDIPPGPIAQETKIQGDADSLRHATRLGLGAAAGAGAAVTGYQLLRWLTSGAPPVNPINYTPAEVELRVPAKKRRPFLLTGHGDGWSKTAEDWATTISRWYNSLGAHGTVGMPETALKNPTYRPQQPAGGGPFTTATSNLLDLNNQPWRNVGMTVGLGTAGALGGYHTGLWLIDQLKKRERKMDLSDAQQEYEDALFSQYKRQRQKKASGPSALDQLYDRYQRAPGDGLEKKALLDWYIPTAIGAGGLSAVVAYLAHRQDTQKLLEEALRRRAGDRAARQPPELTLRTTPVPLEDEVDEEDVAASKPPRRRSSWGF